MREKAFNLTGPPEKAMLNAMRGAGMPEGAVQYVGVLYNAVRAGYTAVVTTDVEVLTDRRPIGFETFVRQNRLARPCPEERSPVGDKRWAAA